MDEPEPDRRAQIVGAALHLLADLSLDELTTRRLAGELGLSQPALFRHFTSRDAIVLAVVARVRSDLEHMAAEVLAQREPVADRLHHLGGALLHHVQTHPGFPRLLFAAALPGAGPIRAAMRHVVSMQSSLVAELVREGQAAGEFSSGARAEDAAALFVGLLQGLVLRWECGARETAPDVSFEGAFNLWLRALSPGPPAAAPAVVAASAPLGPALMALDTAPLLAAGTDPLSAILEAVTRLPPSGVLAVRAPFRPTPLIALLGGRGHAVSDAPLEPSGWLVLIVARGGVPMEDLTDLEPPEPLERVLQRSGALTPGEVYLARVPRFPRLLLQRLAERGIDPTVLELADGTALVRIEGSS